MHLNQNNSHKDLSDAELLQQTLRAAKTEKEATLALLDYLVEIDSRRVYASVNGCSSLFDYLVNILGFSHPAAAERVNTVRLIRAVPPVKQHLETGKLTLTSAAQIQRFVQAEQKVDPKGKSVTTEEKAKVVEACLGKSKREVEKTLLEKQSAPARILTQEKIRTVTENRSEIKFTVDEAILEKLQQLKELVGNSSLEKIFALGLDALLTSEKKKQGAVATKTTATDAVQGRPADQEASMPQSVAQLSSRFIPIAFKRFIFARSQGQCEFIDSRTKARCHSRFKLQIDHVLPRALGGKTEFANLRHLCTAHNLRAASDAGLHRPASTGIH